MRQQAPRPVEPRARLLEARPRRLDLQLHVARIEFGQQLAAPHGLTLRHGYRLYLTGYLESHVRSVVGRRQTGEIAVDVSGRTRHDALYGTNPVMLHALLGAAAREQSRCGYEIYDTHRQKKIDHCSRRGQLSCQYRPSGYISRQARLSTITPPSSVTTPASLRIMLRKTMASAL